MNKLRSADGTQIAVLWAGDGPPLVLVVGAFSDRNSAAELVASLARSYNVCTYDRRGRGASGDAPVYESAREIEDLTAVLDACPQPPFVVGHSSGGALALEAAAAGARMRRLAVYEPPYTGSTPGAAFCDELDELARTGHEGEAAERFLQLTGMPPQALAGIKSSPGWPQMTALAHTLSRELRLTNEGVVPAQRLAAVDVPTLALAGGASPPWAAQATGAIAAAVANGEARVIQGLDHNPDERVLVPILEEFFSAS